jgi:hypothetical protein
MSSPPHPPEIFCFNGAELCILKPILLSLKATFLYKTKTVVQNLSLLLNDSLKINESSNSTTESSH